MTFVVSLHEAADTARYGGKAANLARMLEAGLPVPPGFAISAEAYKKFQPSVPADLKKEILMAFDALGTERVAVRSSAIAEDSSQASWAGQLETVLNVKREGLIEAIEYCWASIQSARAQSYAAEHRVDQEQQAVAVVVQAMIDSEKAGVMFTANPVNGDHNQLVIEAVYGLGELLVQGTETPESLVVDKASEAVLEHNDHQQNEKLVYRSGQNRVVPLEPDEKEQALLHEQERQHLVGVAKAVEAYYQAPQDIEWAIDGRGVWLVQARPITTL